MKKKVEDEKAVKEKTEEKEEMKEYKTPAIVEDDDSSNDEAEVKKKDQAIRKLNAELAKKVVQKADKGVQVDSAKRQTPAQPSSVSLARQQLEKLKAETLAESMKAKNSKYLSFAPPRTPKRIKISFSQYGKCSGESSRQVPNIFTG